MKVLGSVLVAAGKPMELRQLELAPPQTGEVLVRLAASGICRSDLSNARGGSHLPAPIVLGHEAAGIVEQVGPGVTRCAPGDHVVLSLVSQCGVCAQCAKGRPHLCLLGVRAQQSAALLDGTTRLVDPTGNPVHQFLGLGTWAEAVVVPDLAVVPIYQEIDLALAALLGCAVTTAFGAVFNTAPVTRGDTVIVNGCGGVGMNVLQGAALAGARHVIGVEPDEARWPIARELGATLTIPPEQLQATAAELTGGLGADVAYDLVGAEETATALLGAIAPGGTLCLIGARRGSSLPVAIVEDLILGAKRVVGCSYGSSLVVRDIPRSVAALQTGKLDLGRLVTSHINLAGVNDALADLEAGRGLRTLIIFE